MSDLLGRVRAWWDNLSQRERILLSGVGCMLVVTIVLVGIVSPLSAATQNASARADDARQQLDTMIRLRSQYDEVQARLDSVETRIRNSGGRRNTLTFLESLAQSAGVTIDSMEQRKASDDERYKETRVEVALSGVTLRQTMDFLHKIESAEEQFSVKSLRIKRRPDESQTLNVTFSVSSFKEL